MTKAIQGKKRRALTLPRLFVNKTIWLLSSIIVFAGFNNEITQVAFGISLLVTQTP